MIWMLFCFYRGPRMQKSLYSKDLDAFLNFSGQDIPDYHAYGLQIRKRIMKWLSIPTGIGVAPTKALSKIANRIAKKFHERTQGVYVIDSDEKRIKALKWTKIEDVWGIVLFCFIVRYFT